MSTLKFVKMPEWGDKYETILNAPLIFSILVIYQGVFAGNTVSIIPKKLLNLFDNPWFRLFSMLVVSYTATLEIEMALLSTIFFVVFINLLRTPEEKKKFPLGF